jgi:hypothetical protein
MLSYEERRLKQRSSIFECSARISRKGMMKITKNTKQQPVFQPILEYRKFRTQRRSSNHFCTIKQVLWFLDNGVRYLTMLLQLKCYMKDIRELWMKRSVFTFKEPSRNSYEDTDEYP